MPPCEVDTKSIQSGTKIRLAWTVNLVGRVTLAGEHKYLCVCAGEVLMGQGITAVTATLDLDMLKLCGYLAGMFEIKCSYHHQWQSTGNTPLKLDSDRS